jgi:hypothetical protein
MQPRRVIGLASLALGAGMAVNAIVGPLGLGVIESRISDNMENQLVGGEIVSLFVAAPLAVVAGVLWLRGQPARPTAGHWAGALRRLHLCAVHRRAGIRALRRKQ